MMSQRGHEHHRRTVAAHDEELGAHLQSFDAAGGGFEPQTRE
jgi:hypothetical protein